MMYNVTATYTMMLLMGMWMSLTKKPMKPMMANPIAVAMAIFWNSDRRKGIVKHRRRLLEEKWKHLQESQPSPVVEVKLRKDPDDWESSDINKVQSITKSHTRFLISRTFKPCTSDQRQVVTHHIKAEVAHLDLYLSCRASCTSSRAWWSLWRTAGWARRTALPDPWCLFGLMRMRMKMKRRRKKTSVLTPGLLTVMTYTFNISWIPRSTTINFTDVTSG